MKGMKAVKFMKKRRELFFMVVTSFTVFMSYDVVNAVFKSKLTCMLVLAAPT